MGAKRHLNGTSQEGTDTQPDGHRHSMTESAQWADSVKTLNINHESYQMKCLKNA